MLEGMAGDIMRDLTLKETTEKIEGCIAELKAKIMEGDTLSMGDPRVTSPDIIEVFSPPRVVKAMDDSKGFRNGLSLDLWTVGADGKRWDFDDDETQLKALRLIRQMKPLLVIGSPVCTPFSVLQNLNRERCSDPEKRQTP